MDHKQLVELAKAYGVSDDNLDAVGRMFEDLAVGTAEPHGADLPLFMAKHQTVTLESSEPFADSGTFNFGEDDTEPASPDVTEPTVPFSEVDSALGLPGRYRNLGQLGVGAMGQVRRVLDRQLGRTVAIKIAHPENCKSMRLLLPVLRCR